MRKRTSEAVADKQTDKNKKSGASMQDMMQRGIAASEAGDKQTAGAIFRQVAEQYPDNLEVWVWLGWTSESLDDAQAAFARAAELDPSNEEAALGLRWVTSQRPSEAQVEKEAQASEPEPVPEYEPIQAPAPAPVPVYQTQQEQPAAPQFNATNAAPAEPTAVQYELLPPKVPVRSVADMLQQAIKTVQSGDKAMAYRMFQHIASVQDNDPDIWVWLGGTSNSLDDAESAFRRARELDPFHENATLGLRWVALRRQVAYAAAMPSTPAMATSDASTGEASPRKENAFSRFFKRLLRG
jgi:tetratricopeptide (TPR) repeat protein